MATKLLLSKLEDLERDNRSNADRIGVFAQDLGEVSGLLRGVRDQMGGLVNGMITLQESQAATMRMFSELKGMMSGDGSKGDVNVTVEGAKTTNVDSVGGNLNAAGGDIKS